MELTKSLLDVLRCPESGQKLALAPAGVIAAINEGRAESIEAGLLREDGKLFYPIDDGFPVLLIEEAIAYPPES